MDSIAEDPRFSHIVTDPRFRPMPKAKRKVKIDKRFSSLFSSKHFKARTDIDKRGRPVQDVSKRNKHVMERFYELSSDASSENEDENDIVIDVSGKEDRSRSNEGREQDAVEVIDLPPSVSCKTGKKSIKDKMKASEKQMSLSGKKRKLPCPNDDTDPNPKPKPKLSKTVRLITDDDDKAKDTTESTPSDDDDSDDDKTSSDSSENDTSDSDEENLPEYTQDFDIEETTMEHKWNELHTDAVEVSDSTHRLAVCNMDWDFVKAQDLFVLLKSFVPEGGRVKSVMIYPSEFGKERMKEEALLGPKELRDLTKASENGAISENQETGGSVSVSGKKKKGKRKKIPTDQKQEKIADKNMKDFETEKLREYQLNKLRYYYAVVDCDSVETADSVYNECDGKEYQLSSVRLDLRFIPDEMTFDDTPKDSFSEQQGLRDYAPSKFNSSALSQAKVEVTWDETDFDRLSRRIVGLQQKELESMVEDNEYADLIAPPESDSEAETERPDWLTEALAEEGDSDDEDLTEEKKIELYRKVLMEKLIEDKQPADDEIDQEIQWTPGLKSSAEEKLKKKKKKGKELQNDVVEGYLEKKKQKKKQKLGKKKEKISPSAEGEGQLAFSDDELPSDVDEDLKTLMEGEGVAVSSKSKNKKKKEKRKEKEVDSETEREKAELELLLMGNGEQSFSKPKTAEEGKMSKKKKKKLAKLAKEKKEKEKQEFALDMDDDRFSALFTSHHFHIDPNAPQFKKTQNMMELVNEQISHKKRSKAKGAGQLKISSTENEVPRSKIVSQQLVDSLKQKMKKKQ